MVVGMVYRYRSLAPEQEDAYAGGVRARDLADAYGVSVRCIHRVISRRGRSRVQLEVAGYRAIFEVEAHGPVQITPWLPA